MKRLTILLIVLFAQSVLTNAQDPVAMTGRPWEKMTREEHREFMKKRILSTYEPGGVPSIEKLDYYMLVFREQNIFDPKCSVFDVKSEDKGGTVSLSGEVSMPEYKTGLENVLHTLGFFRIENTIRILPDPALGDFAYAVVTSETLSMKRSPREKSEQLNLLVKGAPVWLMKMDKTGRYFLIQSTDGYIGWSDAKDLSRMTLKKWTAYRKVMRDETASRERLTAIAAPLMGIPYVWGGTTNQGMDCSGFTQYIYRQRGINIPRDADQQSNVGEIVAFRGYMDNLCVGDLLFFASNTGRIGHVAISLGGMDYLQSSHENGVHLSSFDNASSNYDAHADERFVFARRILKDGF
jgi:hypothetical protein